MELLNKFENIEIKNDTRVPVEDLKVIEGYSREFEDYRNRVLQYELMFKNKPLNPPLYGEKECYCCSDLRQEKFTSYFYQGFMEDCQRFINKIICYFTDKYQIQLKNDFEKKGKEYSNYRKSESEKRLGFYKNFTYNDVLDNIFEQLGGFDLNSKTEQETKDNMKNLCKSYRDEETIKLTKNKISLKNVYIVTYDSIWGKYRICYSQSDNLNILNNAINYFENNDVKSTELNGLFLTKSGCVKTDLKEDFLCQKHELNFNKVKSIKFFKNKRIDIEFTNGQYALKFARDYCGYMG